jgi:hypothetical protein
VSTQKTLVDFVPWLVFNWIVPGLLIWFAVSYIRRSPQRRPPQPTSGRRTR